MLGLAYPLVITGVAQVAFPRQGRRLAHRARRQGRRLHAARPATSRTRPRYFQPRPSATGYSATATFFSNRGPNQRSRVLPRRLDAYLALEQPYDPGLTAGARARRRGHDLGLGRRPAHLRGQRGHPGAPRRAVRGLPLARVAALIADNTDGRFLGLFGEPGVNMTELNLALDQEASMTPQRSRSAPSRRPALARSQARPAGPGPQPRDVRRRARRADDDRRLADPALRRHSLGGGTSPRWFTFTVTVWLWLTVVFANLAEALAEGRGSAQADALRAMRTDTVARVHDGTTRAAAELHSGDVVVVEAGEVIPGDGTVIEGIASVDESAITGESAPVIRESGGDRSAVTGGTRVLSDRIVVEITQEPGQSFLDRMIALVEGAERRKTPNEIALGILLAALTLVFLRRRRDAAAVRARSRTPTISITTLIALLVALIPTTIGALLSAIGIAGMDRLVRRNVLALSGRAVEASRRRRRAAARQDRHDHARQPPGLRVHPDARRRRGGARRGRAARRRWPTRRPRAARSSCSPSSTACASTSSGAHEAPFVPFTAQTRMSGVDYDGTMLRKGAADAIIACVEAEGGTPPSELHGDVDRIAREGGTPLAVARDTQVLGVDLPQGHRQGGHDASASSSCARWASAP